MAGKAKFSEENRREIEKALKGTHPGHVYKRLQALKLRAINGYNNKQTKQVTGLHETTISRIVTRYQREGMQAITGKRHNHGNRYMTVEQERNFLAECMDTASAGQVIEVRQIHADYEKKVGHPVTRAAIYYMLHKHGWRKIMPRSQHPKKASEEEIQAYKKNQGKDFDATYGEEKPTNHASRRGWIWTNQ